MQQRVFDKVNQTLIKTFICNKLSERSKGQLHYQLWQDNEDLSLGIALSHNESSGGFSSELIKVNDILKTVKELLLSGKPFHATALKGLFIGKSVNNYSFLGAVLVDQQVIRLHPQTARLLEVIEEYELWPLRLKVIIGKTDIQENIVTKIPAKRGPKPKNQSIESEVEEETHNEVH
ncbi:hypothetical protein BFR88_00805 [Acinetobacter pittii]|uniref:hypothetical protein n=1 Tax=Acinetobacter pittii TaxID=48296 RepID=UPI000838AA11|nr:hypothetical protein [Acinetobacter pittii]MCK0899011.1 hypothetical protein [Acinetobacter pittii]MCK0915279.1 hypothetical protein [Acinetobacter pittii]OCY75955.1 hypothetical protein BFR86_01730 [Acinetobacter pittii]OCY82778.1 hypothetical protein BFR87_03615 [Acinetobacter pittii]OCY83464.1 hypothetical protein BFR88_00805 [Acinetobacter pittii]